jgi:hypothetical protein
MLLFLILVFDKSLVIYWYRKLFVFNFLKYISRYFKLWLQKLSSVNIHNLFWFKENCWTWVTASKDIPMFYHWSSIWVLHAAWATSTPWNPFDRWVYWEETCQCSGGNVFIGGASLAIDCDVRVWCVVHFLYGWLFDWGLCGLCCSSNGCGCIWT